MTKLNICLSCFFFSTILISCDKKISKMEPDWVINTGSVLYYVAESDGSLYALKCSRTLRTDTTGICDMSLKIHPESGEILDTLTNPQIQKKHGEIWLFGCPASASVKDKVLTRECVYDLIYNSISLVVSNNRLRKPEPIATYLVIKSNNREDLFNLNVVLDFAQIDGFLVFSSKLGVNHYIEGYRIERLLYPHGVGSLLTLDFFAYRQELV